MIRWSTLASTSVFVSFLFLDPAQSSSSHNACTDPRIHQQIRVVGLQRTDSSVVLREIPEAPPTGLCEEERRELQDRLIRSGIFSRVDVRYEDRDLVIDIDEKWTTIPIAKFRSGGGVQQYTIGVFDPNLFGRRIEAGLQYESLGNVPSGALWYKNPWWWNRRQELEIQLWSVKRIRVKFDQARETPTPTNAFVQDRERLYLQYSKEWNQDLTYRFALDYHSDRFLDSPLPDDLRRDLASPPSLPRSTRFALLRGGLQWGHIRGEHQSSEGQQWTAWLDHGEALNQGDRNFTNFELTQLGYFNFSDRTQLAWRLMAGFTDTNVIQYWIYLGGLDRIRGFSDNRFSGRTFWLTNLELRQLLLDRPRWKMQGVAFTDVAAIGENMEELKQARAASAGLGARWILPQFYRVVLRLDYARPIIKSDSQSVSFGAQQFF